MVETTFPTEALVGRAAIAYAFVLSLMSLGVLLSVIGTMIPAAAIGASTGFKAASRRSRKTFWFVLWRLIVGPALYSVVLMTAMVQLGNLVSLPPLPEGFSTITATNAIFHVAITFLGIFTSALTAAILSMAYVWAEEGQKLALPKKNHVISEKNATQ